MVKNLASETARMILLLLHLYSGRTWVGWHSGSIRRAQGWVHRGPIISWHSVPAHGLDGAIPTHAHSSGDRFGGRQARRLYRAVFAPCHLATIYRVSRPRERWEQACNREGGTSCRDAPAQCPNYGAVLGRLAAGARARIGAEAIGLLKGPLLCQCPCGAFATTCFAVCPRGAKTACVWPIQLMW